MVKITVMVAYDEPNLLTRLFAIPFVNRKNYFFAYVMNFSNRLEQSMDTNQSILMGRSGIMKHVDG
jgi:hypothetical protein